MKNFRDNFDEIYLEYFARLCRFACEYVGDFDEAKSLVQDVFMDLWQRREVVEVRGTLLTYLCSLVRNKCIDLLRHWVTVMRHSKEVKAQARNEAAGVLGAGGSGVASRGASEALWGDSDGDSAQNIEEIGVSLEALGGLDEMLREDADIERAVSEALASLPEKCREIFLLNRVQGKKYREIAEMLGISMNTVETQMGVALRKMREWGKKRR